MTRTKSVMRVQAINFSGKALALMALLTIWGYGVAVFAQDQLTQRVDYAPCRNIEYSKTIRKLSRNIVMYLDYDGENLQAVHVRLTCDYREQNVPRVENHRLMSARTYRMLVAKINKVKFLGKFERDDNVNAVLSPLVAKTRHYSQASIIRFVYSCKQSTAVYGCGLTKFDVLYQPHRNLGP